MKRIAVVCIAAFMSLSFAAIVSATPQKAKQTGKACVECHQGSQIGPHGHGK